VRQGFRPSEPLRVELSETVHQRMSNKVKATLSMTQLSQEVT